MTKLDDRVLQFISDQPDLDYRLYLSGINCTHGDGSLARLEYLMPLIACLINCTLALESKDIVQRLRSLDDLRLFLIDKGIE